VLSLSNTHDWKFVGTLGTEERSICSWLYAKKLGAISDQSFSEIHDVDSEKYRDRINKALAKRQQEFGDNGGQLNEVRTYPLMTELFRIQDFAEACENLGESIIFDITSYPKKFFFVILRDLVQSDKVRNLLITYTSPGTHTNNNEPLYEDPETWKELPGFGAVSNEKPLWIVSVGFLVESLNRYVGDHPDEKMKLLVPFPGPLASTRRVWEGVASLDKDTRDGRFEMVRVDTIDMSSAFDRIESISRNAKAVAFAPLGPKPISAAMCLYSLQKDASVHYPQPTVYHPEYSRGIYKDDPKRAVNAYWVKHEGENLYEI
jgi:hypothetical protein